MPIFQKDLNELTLLDLNDFFATDRQETSTLEFKSGKAELEKIVQEVCAFLNTDGGVIVYGSPIENNNKDGIKVCSGQLSPTSHFNNKVTLGSSIAANISPAPSGINIHQIEKDGKYIFILDVPKSLHAPHQYNNQGKYYIRMDSEARAAPHGLVEAMFFKRQKPNLDLKIRVEYKNTQKNNLELTFSIDNNSEYTAENIGHLFKIYGVQSFEERASYKDFTIIRKSSVLTIENSRIKTILVKGISYITKIDFEPLKTNQIIIHAIIWCKDISAREYYFTLDPLNHAEVNEIYYSELDKEKPDIDSLLMPFK